MKRFFAQLSTHQTINRPADRMELVDNSIRVYCGDELVAFLDADGKGMVEYDPDQYL